MTLYWDAKSLEVSEECLEDIKKVKDHKTLSSFNEKYGHIFSKRVRIGGRLSSSEKVTSTQDASTQSQIRKLKANASASVSSSFFQASASYSNEKQSNESKSSDSKSLNKSMAWEATGGDTLLCNRYVLILKNSMELWPITDLLNSPAQWCSTVSHYENWRIVNVSTLHGLGCNRLIMASSKMRLCVYPNSSPNFQKLKRSTKTWLNTLKSVPIHTS